MEDKGKITVTNYRTQNNDFIEGEGYVAKEYLLTIFVNGLEYATLLCSPNEFEYLAVGFLISSDLIKKKDDIISLGIDETRGVAEININSDISQNMLGEPRLVTSGCGGSATFYGIRDAELKPVDSKTRIKASVVSSLARQFQRMSNLYVQTHGNHSAAIIVDSKIELFSEDISRHNAVDKVFGKSIYKRIPVSDKVLVTSGRISFEIVKKAALMRIPVIASVASPLSLGIEMADKFGIALIGNVRQQSLRIFSHGWRISN